MMGDKYWFSEESKNSIDKGGEDEKCY